MSSWFNYVHLLNLHEAYEALEPGPDRRILLQDFMLHEGRKSWEDPAFSQMLRVLQVEQDGGNESYNILEWNLCKWLRENGRGPGSFDSTELDMVFSLMREEGGAKELDRLFGLFAELSLTDAVAQTRVLHSPLDEGLHHGDCYSLHIDVTTLDLRNMAGRRQYVAMASSLTHLIPLAIEAVAEQSERYNRLWAVRNDFHRSDEYTSETKLRRAKPVGILINKNGEQVLKANIPNRNAGEEFDVDWAGASYPNHEVMTEVAGALPTSLGRRVKAGYLSNDLGI
ncbi:hypothetical protein [Pseudomonas putida]|uniref:Uncharacterized protein n=1 Tax=Pseudomonas putida TaxID=303 RepID=A0A8I1EBG8_PSEPU|nr:hypothetical protein [Pseudomonas putida]MBI6882725.1 hypothetical protein [Pseudomonas putida]